MDLDEARAFVAQNSHTVLTTLRKDGTPQMSPVDVAVVDDGTVVISSRETAYKTKNLRRDPRASLYVDGPNGRWYVVLEGKAELTAVAQDPNDETVEALVDYYRTASGEHPDWDDYRAAMVRDQRCLLRVTVTKAGPDRQG